MGISRLIGNTVQELRKPNVFLQQVAVAEGVGFHG
jgi:hypothetical protein